MRNFSETILALYGEAGRKWLASLPALLASYAQDWDLTLEAPFENLSYNYVAPARRADGSLTVIKIGFPNDELRSEIAALRHFDGQGMVRLLDADEENCAMLLERILPGETLWEMEDERVTAPLLDVMPKFWKVYSEDYPFKSVRDWGKAFSRLRARYDGGTGKLDAVLVEKAERIFFALLESSDEPILLHGDLHHDNVLSTDQGSYIAIDPKGVLGEACYEVGAFLRNPLPALLQKENPQALTRSRVDMVVERLAFDRERVISWGFSQAVLSAIWCDEDGVSCTEMAMRVAGILDNLL
ncbi:MAG: phosphotransferase [Chloroflexi bacterium]|nr:phosphotransferase [Chloroflexota bacterium]